MTFEEYIRHDGLSLAALVRNRHVQPSELLDLAIARAEAVNPEISAVIHRLYDLARSMAANADLSGPFAGVPLLIKDLELELAGTPLWMGCKGLQHHVSKTDSEVISRLRKAGFLFMGKTNTPEFGLTPYTEPRAFGPSRNPWNPAYTTGGSSGGSAAAVAAGITPVATASDGGGSIRIPASCCGVFGLKPSRARVSLGPHYGDAWQGAVAQNCVTRSVRDSAAMLDAISGPVPGDPYGIPAPTRPYLEEVGHDPGRLRVAFSTRHTLGHTVDPECVAAVEHTCRLLESLGHHVEEAPLPYRHEDLSKVFVYMIMGDVAATVSDLEPLLGRPATRHDVEPNTWALALLGRSLSAEKFVLAKRRWNEISRRLAAFHETYDLLLTPTASTPPFPVGKLQPSASEERLIGFINRLGLGSLAMTKIDELAEKIFSFIPWTAFANMTGQPSMSVPLYWSKDELPVGTMLTAPFGREDMLYQVAGQLEQAQPWNKVALL